MNNLKQAYMKLYEKKDLVGQEALMAVKQNSDALRYVDGSFFVKDEPAK